VKELPPPLAIEPDEGLVEDAVDPVEPGEVAPVVEPVALPVVEPVDDPVLPGEVVEGLVLEPVVEPVADPVVEPVVDPELLPLGDILALVSMKLPPAEAELPAVPVAPVVPAPDAVLPAPDPDTRQPVTTTDLLSALLVELPVWPGVPLGVCAAAPAPSATAIIVPKRNCRFITSSVLG
jgi:hypothetical protein